MAELETKNASTALYRYLCRFIIGTEEHVKTIRLLTSARDDLSSDKNTAIITSGSLGEGLVTPESDLDMMSVIKNIEVCEDNNVHFNHNMTYNIIMETDYTQPGYTRLRMKNGYRNIRELHVSADQYLKNTTLKPIGANQRFSHVHGPCLTDKDGLLDYCFCLRSKTWVSQAEQWITRSKTLWPAYEVRQSIVKHGVLFVPVGVRGSNTEILEWRISFSVAEKILIYTFTHTQLLCYVLMKILLKDVIENDLECKDLLCSYFMKTNMFWISEELTQAIWRPENLISNFIKCLRRLIYYVEYSVCPHYFIPENNLFIGKITGVAQKTLLDKLYKLRSYGWQCLTFSDKIPNLHSLSMFSFYINKAPWKLRVESIKQFLITYMIMTDNLPSFYQSTLAKGIHRVLQVKSSNLKYIYSYYMSQFYCRSMHSQAFENKYDNKFTYKQCRIYLSSMLINTQYDAVSGWLMLASFFYTTKQYNKAIYTLRYSLCKCSHEKIFIGMKWSPFHYELLNLNLFRNMTILQICKLMVVKCVNFWNNNIMIPKELRNGIERYVFPPVVYIHFLRFLCYYQLRNTKLCQKALRDLQMTIEDDYFIAIPYHTASSYDMLDILIRLMDDKRSER